MKDKNNENATNGSTLLVSAIFSTKIIEFRSKKTKFSQHRS